jgi:hypothetical protein
LATLEDDGRQHGGNPPFPGIEGVEEVIFLMLHFS